MFCVGTTYVAQIIFEELKKAVYVNLLLQLFRFYNKLGQ